MRLGLLPVMLVILSACGGPLSMVSYAVGAGVAMHAEDEQREYEEKETYINKCLPIHRKENPLVAGAKKEEQGNLVRAYEYYRVANYLGYREAIFALENIQPKMKPEQLKTAEKNLKKYTEIHLHSCFLAGGN